MTPEERALLIMQHTGLYATQADCDLMQAKIATALREAEARAERAEAALREIIAHEEGLTVSDCERCSEIARAALEAKP